MNGRKRILITGGAGFLGSQLCELLLKEGHDVVCLDNLSTGSKDNIRHLLDNPFFEFIRHDVVQPILLEVEQIYHLACPASPVHYQENPVKTVKTSVIGTINMLGLAKRVGARILLASSSEVYGDPDIHPQVESYRGNVSTTGIRSCYDEGKRVAETLMTDYHRQHGVDIRIARIFNTYGPRMALNDGRVISAFIIQALGNKPVTVYGDGSQTRSFCYVDDCLTGLTGLMNKTTFTQPVNIGNPEEQQIIEVAKIILHHTGSSSPLINEQRPLDDPQRRCPDIRKAYELFGWYPHVSFDEGICRTIEYFSRLK